ncbi:MAG: 50S ribosomal protein L9 [Spirochaetaceae bacterium]|jgi:large subunit ribosomal protein L9|nr:50S ribosomal protein L9 [Spirochaetaceae bacterium]
MNTKVILNKDLATLGEEGDVKYVARGYARNFLLPRGIAVPFNERTQKMFDARRGEIEARKAEKRKDAASLKERLEALDLTIVMPAGGNGKLYGAVTTQTVMDELSKHGFAIERKKIEIPGNSIKNAGKHKLTVKLYDNTSAEVSITIEAQQTKAETPAKRRSHHNEPVAGPKTMETTEPVSEGEPDEAAQVSEPESVSVSASVAEPAAESTVPPATDLETPPEA